jgi:hypothetical protein
MYSRVAVAFVKLDYMLYASSCSHLLAAVANRDPYGRMLAGGHVKITLGPSYIEGRRRVRQTP